MARSRVETKGIAMRKAVLAGVAAVSLAGAAIAAPSGAPQDEAMQAGGWGPGGWQGGGYGPGPMDGSAMAPAPMMGPAPMMPPPPMMRGDDKPVRPGQKLKGRWRDPSLTVSDWQAWGLGAPGQGMRWIRYYDDAVLVDADDRVVTARGGIPWDAPRQGGYGYHAGYGDDHGGMGGPGWHHPPIAPGRTTYRAGPDTVVTTQVIAPPPIVYGGGYAPGYGAGYGYGYAGAGTTVIVTPGVVTTTTTTTTERVWHKVRVRGCRCARPTRSGKLVRR